MKTKDVIFEVNVEVDFNGSWEVNVKVTSNTSKFISGHVELVGKDSGFDFAWKKGKFPLPYVSNIRRHGQPSTNWQKTQPFAKAALDALVENVVGDNAGSSVGLGGDIDPNYVSQLINAGHVRRPCRVQTKSGVVIRRGCVVNPAKLSADDLAAAKRVVDLWNDLATKCGDPISFNEWFDRYISH